VARQTRSLYKGGWLAPDGPTVLDVINNDFMPEDVLSSRESDSGCISAETEAPTAYKLPKTTSKPAQSANKRPQSVNKPQ
jgi:hypothetical protein